MALPVLIGPNRCELIYNHDKQPLLELSLRVSLPVVELLNMLGQLASPATVQAAKPQRPPTKGPPSSAVRKDPVTSQVGKPTMRQVHLPQGSCSSDWQPSFNQWEPGLQPTWEPCPAASGAWQGEWTTSNPQVEEQTQLLWALSDQAVPRYRKVPPNQLKANVPVKKRTDKEVRFSSSPEEGNGPHGSPAKAKSVATRPKEERLDERVSRHQDDSADEHHPPPRPFAHPKSVRSSRARCFLSN